jgi:hemoglobin-like flavoprotein
MEVQHMGVMNKTTVDNYKKTLTSYAELYELFSTGKRKGKMSFVNDEKLVKEVMQMAAYLRMLEALYPTLKDYKPASYKAIYYSIKKGK